MIKQLLVLIWTIIDVVFYLISAIFANIFAYSFGIRWFYLSLAITFAVTALTIEMLAPSKQGGNN